MKAALRDIVRSSYLGGIIRSTVIMQLRKNRRMLEARRLSKDDPSRFHCPICDYDGVFVDRRAATGERKALRKYASCPECGSAERHRLQFLILKDLLSNPQWAEGAVLHFAPEEFLAARLKQHFKLYRSVDLFRRDVDIRADVTVLPIADDTFDLVYASHVLEHVPDDRRAIAEIHRVLKPGGVAILPVPIYSTANQPSQHTVEYGRAVKEEDGHVRAPGLDYFDRYREVFQSVEVKSSTEFGNVAESSQLFIRPVATDGESEIGSIPDFVPLCYKKDRVILVDP